MQEYKKHFDINEDVIFALFPDIYTNNELTPDLLIHEGTHLKQQEKIGVKEWVERYLNEPQFRLTQEIEAYKNQIHSIKDRNARSRCRIQSSQFLASSLYGNIINYKEAFDILK